MTPDSPQEWCYAKSAGYVGIDIAPFQKHTHNPLIPALSSTQERYSAIFVVSCVGIDIAPFQRYPHYPITPLLDSLPGAVFGRICQLYWDRRRCVPAASPRPPHARSLQPTRAVLGHIVSGVLGLMFVRSSNTLTTPSCPFPAAYESSVRPYLVSATLGSMSLRSSSTLTTPECPLLAAQVIAVLPLKSLARTSHLFISNKVIIISSHPRYASAAKLSPGLLKSLPYMLRDSFSVDKLFNDGSQHACGGLFLMGKEIAVESHDGNVPPPSLIT